MRSVGSVSISVNCILLPVKCSSCLSFITLCIGTASFWNFISRYAPLVSFTHIEGMLSSKSTLWQLGSSSIANCSCGTTILEYWGSTAVIFCATSTFPNAPRLPFISAPRVKGFFISNNSGLLNNLCISCSFVAIVCYFLFFSTNP